MDVFIRVDLYLTVQRTLLAARHRPMETTSLQIELVYYFRSTLVLKMCIYFSY